MSIKIYGASDDLIEIEGDIREEFGFYLEDSEPVFIAVSDGTLLRVEYDEDGIWRINKITGGLSEFSKVDGSVEEDTPDIVTLSGIEIKWVVLGIQKAVKKG